MKLLSAAGIPPTKGMPAVRFYEVRFFLLTYQKLCGSCLMVGKHGFSNEQFRMLSAGYSAAQTQVS